MNKGIFQRKNKKYLIELEQELGRQVIPKEKIAVIYIIKNNINEKFYLGSTKHVYNRWSSHYNNLLKNKHHNKHLQNAWNKYGEENFSFKVLEIIDTSNILNDKIIDKKIRKLEQKYLDELKPYDSKIGYNFNTLATGGLGEIETIELMKSGKGFITYKQFQDITILLQSTQMPYTEIAKFTNTTPGIVKSIYKKQSYKYLTKDMVFKYRGRDVVKHNLLKIKDKIKQSCDDGLSGPQIVKKYNLTCTVSYVNEFIQIFQLRQ